MKILLDTHLLIWSLEESDRLSSKARELIEYPNNEIFYSIISPWEITIKHMAHPDTFVTSGKAIMDFCELAGFRMITVNKNHVLTLQTLKRHSDAPLHKDPFDRIMLAQAKAEGMGFLTHDVLLGHYNEDCVIIV